MRLKKILTIRIILIVALATMAVPAVAPAHAQFEVPDPTCAELGTCIEECTSEGQDTFLCPIMKQWTEKIGNYAVIGYWGAITVGIWYTSKDMRYAGIAGVILASFFLGTSVETGETADLFTIALILLFVSMGLSAFFIVRKMRE